MHSLKDFSPPLEMIEILNDLKEKINGSRDLSPDQYMKRDVKLLYSIAHKHYSIDNFIDAEPLFINLVLARPLEKIYWKGLAASRQMLKNYEGALVCWGMIALISPEDLAAHIFGAECLYQLGALEETAEAVAYIEKHITEEHPNYGNFYRIKLSTSEGK
jgi:tetratricopeptide (TPR) repeat protein